jgi:virulence-associated protein VapD
MSIIWTDENYGYSDSNVSVEIVKSIPDEDQPFNTYQASVYFIESEVNYTSLTFYTKEEAIDWAEKTILEIDNLEVFTELELVEVL